MVETLLTTLVTGAVSKALDASLGSLTSFLRSEGHELRIKNVTLNGLQNKIVYFCDLVIGKGRGKDLIPINAEATPLFKDFDVRVFYMGNDITEDDTFLKEKKKGVYINLKKLPKDLQVPLNVQFSKKADWNDFIYSKVSNQMATAGRLIFRFHCAAYLVEYANSLEDFSCLQIPFKVRIDLRIAFQHALETKKFKYYSAWTQKRLEQMLVVPKVMPELVDALPIRKLTKEELEKQEKEVSSKLGTTVRDYEITLQRFKMTALAILRQQYNELITISNPDWNINDISIEPYPESTTANILAKSENDDKITIAGSLKVIKPYTELVANCATDFKRGEYISKCDLDINLDYAVQLRKANFLEL